MRLKKEETNECEDVHNAVKFVTSNIVQNIAKYVKLKNSSILSDNYFLVLQINSQY